MCVLRDFNLIQLVDVNDRRLVNFESVQAVRLQNLREHARDHH
jgi:hypothetical protein